MVDKNCIIGEVLDKYPDTAELFFGIGMHCLGCPGARSETIEQASMVHGADCAKVPPGAVSLNREPRFSFSTETPSSLKSPSAKRSSTYWMPL